MRAIRLTLERPDAVTESAVSARDHIGRAIADKIRMTESASQLKKVVEEVLPEIEKFLESPSERRLRRLRAGMIMAFIGVGATLGSFIASTMDRELFVLMIPSLIMLFIGLSVMLNGIMFTIPRRQLGDYTDRELDPKLLAPTKKRSRRKVAAAIEEPATNELDQNQGSSVTEHTTHHLSTDR